MPVLFIYLLKLSISLAVVYLFYSLVLRRLTFYNWNRWYLLGYTFLSFIIASTNITPFLQNNSLADDKTIRLVPLVESITGRTGTFTTIATAETAKGWNSWEWCLCLVITGVLFLLTRLLIQYLSFLKIRRNALLLSDKGMRLYQVEENIIPFSFGNSIFVNQSLHTGPELGEIIRHEFVHVKQRHSIDIIWTELLCIFNWYNPFAWLLRQAVRQNLEFIADNKVVANGIDRKQYQYLLLKVIGNNQFSIAQKFNFTSLKKRIAMMNKLRSARLNLVRFLFVLPLAAILLLAFRNRLPDRLPGKQVISESTLTTPGNMQTMSVVGTFVKKESGTFPVPDTTPITNKGKLNQVATDFEINDKEAVLKLKDGTVEKYDLTDAKQKEAFEKKYGKIISIKGNQNINTNISSNTNVIGTIAPTATIATTIALDGEIVVTPVTVTGIGVGSGKGIGVGTISTVAPVTVVSGTGLTTTAPIVVEGVPLSKNIVAPVTLASGVSGTTVIAPMNPIPTGEGVSVIDEENVIINGKEEVLVTITSRTTSLQLDEFKKQLKDKGLDLSFKNIEYNTKGILTYIDGTIDSKNGHSNFVAVDFEKLILSMITDGNRVYFKVRVKEKEVI